MAMIKTKFYMHSTCDDDEKGIELGITDKEALRTFRHCGYEVEFDIEVDTDTGRSWATHVGGVALASKVEI
jgi:hypothetical protein